MNKYNIAGILRTHAEQCIKANTNKHLVEIIRRMKEELREEMRPMKAYKGEEPNE